MPKKLIFCESCQKEYTVSYKGQEEPTFCPFCGDNVDLEWSADDGEDNE